MSGLARKTPDNPIVRFSKKDGGFGKVKGWTKIEYFEDGEKKKFYMNPTWAREWVQNNAEVSPELSSFMRFVLGGDILRPFATGINPAFIVSNLPLDIFHIWGTSTFMNKEGEWKSMYSPHLPIAAAQMVRDVAAVLPHIWKAKKGSMVWDFINEGGSFNFLSSAQGKPRLFQTKLGIRGKIGNVLDVLGYFNKRSELVTRLALRERGIRNGLTPREASLHAREYMDFGSYGGMTKAVDSAIPYFGTGFEASRGLFRSFKRTPKEAAIKASWLIMTAIGKEMAHQALNPEGMKDLNPETENLYWNFLPPSWKYEDASGQIRYGGFRIRKDPGQAFFSAVGTAIARKLSGKGVDVEQLIDALNKMLPFGVKPSELLRLAPPTFQALGALVLNKDFWNAEDIWRDSEVPSGEKGIIGRTNPLFLRLGKLTGLPPAQAEAAMKKFFTRDSVYAQALGAGTRAMMEDVPESQRSVIWLESLRNGDPTGAARRLFFITNPITKFTESLDNAEAWSNSTDVYVKQRVDQIARLRYTEEAIDGQEALRRIRGVIKDERLRPKEQKKMIERYKFWGETQHLKNRVFWLRVQGMNLKGRAKVFAERWENSSDEEKQALRKEMAHPAVKPIFSQDFWGEFRFQAAESSKVN